MTQSVFERIDIEKYGPFDVPKKERWLVVGSGPSSERAIPFIMENPSVGVITVGLTLKAVPRTDVHIFSHYEGIAQALPYFKKASRVFIPNPIHVGLGYHKLPLFHLFEKDTLLKYSDGNIRLYKKCSPENTNDPDGLMAHHSVASTALHLLFRNGVRDVLFAGIDGGSGRALPFKESYGFIDSLYERTYDKARNEFLEFGELMNMRLEAL